MNLNAYFGNILNKRFRALTHRDFRLYWMGQFVSSMGTWMQNIGLTWLVFSITGSPFLIGLLETVRFLPVTLFSLFAGAVIDKYPKRKILLITQTVSMVLAFILSLLVFTNKLRYEYVLILALILGLSNSIDMPAKQSFMVEMTGKEDLMNAIALISVTSNLARIIGPALGALVLAYLGADWCFLLNGLSFAAVIASLLRIEARPYVREKVKGSNMLGEIKDGLKYIALEKSLLYPILLITIAGIFLYDYEVLVPVLTKNVLHQNEKGYGFLMSSFGLGSLLGAMMLSMKSKSKIKHKVLFSSSIIISLLLMLIGLSKNYYITSILLVISGIATIWFSTNAFSMIQLTTKDEYRGRVTGVFSLVNSGTAPVGYMISGAAATRFGADKTFFLCGMVTIVLIVLFKLVFGKVR